MKLDYRGMLTTVIASVLLGGLGWVVSGNFEARAAQIQQQEVNKSFEVADTDNAKAIKDLRADIERLRSEMASKEDMRELKKLTEKLLDLQLRELRK